MIKVGLAEDHELVRKGVSMLLKTFNEIELIFEVANGHEVLKCLQREIPNILLLDLHMDPVDGAECCSIVRLKYPDIKVLIISHFSDLNSIKKAVQSGAHGYFTKNSPLEQLEAALHDVEEYDFYFNTDLKETVEIILNSNQSLAHNHWCNETNLSFREKEIIKLVCKQLTSGQIADILYLNVRTVESHRKRIMEKISAKNFIGVVLYSLKHKLVNIEDL